MDPVTILTAAVTSIGACNALIPAVRKSHRPQNVPKEILELEEDTRFLQSCVGSLNHLAQTHGDHNNEIIGKLSISLQVNNASGRVRTV